MEEQKQQQTIRRPYRNAAVSLLILFVGVPFALGIIIASMILTGGFSIAMLVLSASVFSTVLAGFSYCARLIDELRTNPLNREQVFTLAGLVVGAGFGIATAVMGLPDLGYGNVGIVAANVTATVANMGAFAGLFNRAGRVNRAGNNRLYRTDRIVIFSVLGIGITAGAVLVGIGFNVSDFTGLQGLSISGHSIGPIPAEALFIPFLVISLVSCADYVNKAFTGCVLPLITNNPLPETNDSEKETVRENANAAKGVGFALLVAAAIVILSFTTTLVPPLSIPAIIATFVVACSGGGGIATRLGRAYSGLKNTVDTYWQNTTGYQPVVKGNENTTTPTHTPRSSSSRSSSLGGGGGGGEEEKEKLNRSSTSSFTASLLPAETQPVIDGPCALKPPSPSKINSSSTFFRSPSPSPSPPLSPSPNSEIPSPPPPIEYTQHVPTPSLTLVSTDPT